MQKNIKGASLIEMLVAVSVFAVLGVILTQSLVLTLRGSRKSEAQIKVRENLDYAFSVIERQLRNANSISECPNSDTRVISYTDGMGVLSNFSCLGTDGVDAYISSGSARLTSEEIIINSCSFVCSAGSTSIPPSVTVNLSAKSGNSNASPESSQATLNAQILLRSY